VKLSNTTSSRTSARTSALPARTPVSQGGTKANFDSIPMNFGAHSRFHASARQFRRHRSPITNHHSL